MRPKTIALAMGLLLPSSVVAAADKSYGPGVSDSEIKLGQSIPYSGPASAFSVVGRVQVAYFKMLNAQGGINGRKVELISLDNGFSPPKAV
ncbi:MAG TPA: ABC transporter substrate-binding protein, partial [Reyranella sp.]|nr:ABC transporter substrate-binding protein [Reyranella sp.]